MMRQFLPSHSAIHVRFVLFKNLLEELAPPYKKDRIHTYTKAQARLEPTHTSARQVRVFTDRFYWTYRGFLICATSVVTHARITKWYTGMRAKVNAITVGCTMHLMFGPWGIDQAYSHYWMPVLYVRATRKKVGGETFRKFINKKIIINKVPT